MSVSHTDGMEILFILGLWAASLDSCSVVIKSIVLVWILLKSEPEFKIQFIQQVTLQSKKEEVVWAKGIMRPENDSKSTEAALVMGTGLHIKLFVFFFTLNFWEVNDVYPGLFTKKKVVRL